MTKLSLALLCLPFVASAALAQDVKVQIQGDNVQIQMPNVPGLPTAPGGGSTMTVQTPGLGSQMNGKGGSSMSQVTTQAITSQAIGQGNTASVTTGISPDADVQGVTVINCEVWIDGEKVPPDAKRFTGKSGTKYVIDRGKTGVNVHSE